MNQNLYRIVFNKARGCLMAVAETATSHGKPGSRSSKPRTNFPRRSAVCIALAAAGLAAPLANAQIAADPRAPANQRPTVLTTGSNNIPLVNIQTPSAAGVSRNTYSQFDVNRAGAVLNNSRSSAQTQLGGWVQGNPWLATGSARVILNEVNSSNPSQLRGAIEVAGQRAELIIANPSGIVVDGAGFINASRATLTTGTPILNNGSLDGFRVQAGTVTVTGAGLDASGTDSTAILARAVAINAGIWAKQLNITTGANTVSADASRADAIGGTGSAPGFALDVAAIGGMYAGKITLIGTEAGLGVRNAGVIQANAGDLVLSNDGWLSNTGSLSASHNLTAQTSGAVSNSGSIYASGNTAVTAGGDIGNSNLIAAQGDAALASSGAITSARGAVLAAGLNADNTLATSGQLSITASGSAALNGQSLAGADMRVTGGAIDATGGQLSAQNLSLTASAGNVNVTGATLAASHTLAIGTSQNLRTDGAVLSAGQFDLAAHGLSNVGGQLRQTGTGDLALNLAGGLDNRSGVIATNGSASLTASTVDNTQGSISTGGDLAVQAATVTNTGTLYAGGSQTVAATGTVHNSGVIAALGNTTVTAQSLDSTATSLQAAGLKADGGLAGAGDLRVVATQGLVANGQNIAAGSLRLDGMSLDLSGSQTSGTNLVLHASTGNLDASRAKLVATQALNASSTQTLNTDAAVLSAGQLKLTARDVSNVGGQLLQTGVGDVVLQLTGALDNTEGRITANGNLKANASGAITNTGGLLAAMGAVTLSAASLDNRQGSIASVQDAMSLSTAGATRNDGGHIQATLDLTLHNAGLRNSGADSVISGQNLLLDTQGQSFENAGGTVVASRSASLQTGGLNNDGGLIQAGSTLGIDTHGQQLTNSHATSHFSGAGGISAHGPLTLATGDLNNAAGFIGTGATLSAATAKLDNSAGGRIVGQSKMTFNGTGFDNRAGQVQALGDVGIDVGTGTIHNSAGLLRSAATLALAAATVDNSNTQGSDQGIEAGNVAIVGIGAGRIVNNAGAVRADADITLSSSGSVDNSQGLISAGNTITLQDLAATKTLTVTNTGGRQIAARNLAVNSASLTGDGQLLSQNDIAIRLTSDFNNSGQVTANGNASISTTGNIGNSGTLQAGRTLALSASNIDNGASGSISATTTRLTARNTLSNRGLIDGSDTQIDAGQAGGSAASVNNIGTGRIYGDHVSIAAGTVNNLAENGSAATIAARDRLDIGAGVLNNTGGAQILSLGDVAIGGSLASNRLATGAAGTITNSASTIQAMGNLAINTATLNNLNPGFNYTLATDASSSATDYIASDGTVYHPSDFGWDSGGVPYKFLHYQTPGAPSFGGFYRPNDLQNGGQLRSSPYADPIYKQFYEGPNAHSPALTIHPVGTPAGETLNDTHVPETFAYDHSSPIWQVFGVAPPTVDTPGPYPVGTHNAQRDIDPTAAEIDAWQAKAAPWLALQAKLDAFRAVVKSYMLTVQTYRDYTETSQSAQVTASTPGQILAGGNLAINAGSSVLNDNSRIIAGAALNITGAAVNNRATEVTTTKTRDGTVHTWGVIGEDCSFFFGCSPVYGWLNNGYTQNLASTVTLGTNVTQSYANAGAAATSIAGRGIATAVNGLQMAGQANVALPGAMATTGRVQISATPPATGNAAALSPPSVARLTQVTTGAGATVQSVQPNTTLPTASLFHAAPDVAVRYLVETDPAFTNYRQWLSSDALLSALSYDPATVQKRLGDGFYEQQLIREQVAELTGHRFLAGYGSDEAQYQALIASGATYAKQWNLLPGIALSAAQMAQLTTDMVWLVEQTVTLVDGSTQQVLVPQLYALARDGDLSNSGALLSGGSVNINLSGDLTNAGTIMGRSVVALTADSINNLAVASMARMWWHKPPRT